MVLLRDLHVLLVLRVLNIAKNRHDCRVLHFVRDYGASKGFLVYGLGFHIVMLVVHAPQ